MPRRPGPVPVPVWRLRPLRAVAAALVCGAAVLVAGLAHSVVPAAEPSPEPTGLSAARTTGDTRAARRDRIAAEPMVEVPAEDALPTGPASRPAPTIRVPSATRLGPADVPTGFPPTPEGAVAQLAAIEIAVLPAMSIRYTHTVHKEWAMPGAPDAADWPLAVAVRTFLDRADMGAEKDPWVIVAAVPAAGQVKGVDGPDWVVACVLLDVRAVVAAEARIGFGLCERMQWRTDRWRVAPGPPPARAPSTWPGSEAAARAGWRAWSTTGGQ